MPFLFLMFDDQLQLAASEDMKLSITTFPASPFSFILSGHNEYSKAARVHFSMEPSISLRFRVLYYSAMHWKLFIKVLDRNLK